ncbi:MAG: nitrite reductase small subunit NirD [Cyclobacteriaceae bacterium]
MTETLELYKSVNPQNVTLWVMAGETHEFPQDGALCVKYNDLQIAVFNFSRRGEWFAAQNLCPHKYQMILSRGMIGSDSGEPKVACPFHKKTFSLKSGKNLNGDECALATYPVKVEEGKVYVGVI